MSQERAELMDAAIYGMREYLTSTRGAATWGRGASILPDFEKGTIRVLNLNAPTKGTIDIMFTIF